MKSDLTRLLALAIMIGAAGCEKPAYRGAKAGANSESVPAEIEVPAAPLETEFAELSPRDRILAIREENIGKTFQDLEINGTPLGEVSIVSIDDAGVSLRHGAGVSGYAWADLPAELRETWGHDPIVTPLALAEVPAAEPAPKVLDPGTRARVWTLQTQIAKLDKNLQHAHKTVEEAQAFHTELAAIYQAEEEKAAALKAARVFARMRRSSCSS